MFPGYLTIRRVVEVFTRTAFHIISSRSVSRHVPPSRWSEPGHACHWCHVVVRPCPPPPLLSGFQSPWIRVQGVQGVWGVKGARVPKGVHGVSWRVWTRGGGPGVPWASEASGVFGLASGAGLAACAAIPTDALFRTSAASHPHTAMFVPRWVYFETMLGK